MQFSVVAQNLRNEEQVAIIQASTVLSLAEKVSVIVYKKKKKSSLPFLYHQRCIELLCNVCRPLVDPADRGDGGGTAPENDGPGD